MLKRRLEQALLLRGDLDFESVAAVAGVRRRGRAQGEQRAHDARAREVGVMRELALNKLREFVEEPVRVSEWSTVRVKHCAYSVPSRLIGEMVRARVVTLMSTA